MRREEKRKSCTHLLQAELEDPASHSDVVVVLVLHHGVVQVHVVGHGALAGGRRALLVVVAFVCRFGGVDDGDVRVVGFCSAGRTGAT